MNRMTHKLANSRRQQGWKMKIMGEKVSIYFWLFVLHFVNLITRIDIRRRSLWCERSFALNILNNVKRVNICAIFSLCFHLHKVGKNIVYTAVLVLNTFNCGCFSLHILLMITKIYKCKPVFDNNKNKLTW